LPPASPGRVEEIEERSAVSVLHVLTRAYRRGAETFGLDLHRELTARGEGSAVLALAPAPPGQRSIDVPVLGPAPRHPRTLVRLRRATADVDVVVAHGSSTLLACRLALLASSTPFIYVNIGDPLYWTASRSRRARVRWMLRGAAAVAAISPTARDRLISHLDAPPGRVRFIGNGRSARHFSPSSPEGRLAARARFELQPTAPTAVVVAALGPEKRVDVAIRAISLLPSWQLLVVGAGPLAPQLQALADAEAPERVRFAGVREDMDVAYAAADVALLTSETEGLPGVLIEAAMCGLPVVSTDVGFTADIVPDGHAGRLVPVGDVAATSAALAECHRNQLIWGRQARAHAVQGFDLDAVVDRWQALLHDVASDRHRS
jgi:glycosyltransferase involved in cell wall biosynthesis